jgi:hypothetical protein
MQDPLCHRHCLQVLQVQEAQSYYRRRPPGEKDQVYFLPHLRLEINLYKFDASCEVEGDGAWRLLELEQEIAITIVPVRTGDMTRVHWRVVSVPHIATGELVQQRKGKEFTRSDPGSAIIIRGPKQRTRRAPFFASRRSLHGPYDEDSGT